MNALLNNKLKNVKWGEFKITEIFEVKNTSSILSSDITEGSGHIPYLCASSENNAVSSYISYEKRYLEKGNCIFIGGKTFVVTYQESAFFSNDSHNLALYLKDREGNKAVYLFIASCINKSLCQKYSWGNSISKTKIQNDNVILPILLDGQIDFDFMESFIAELEAERLTELEAERLTELSAYLSVSGLNDYELTEEEKDALEEYETLIKGDDKATLRRWGYYRFKEIFNNIKQGRRLKKEDQIPGRIPFVMAGITNTGVVNNISNPVAFFPGNSITIDIFGNTFYRNYSYGAGDDTGVYWNSETDYSRNRMLFFAASMKRSLVGKYSYGNKLRSSKSGDIKMALPVNQKREMDYSYIENLISAVHKLVIKDVVMYSNRKIDAAKIVLDR